MYSQSAVSKNSTESFIKLIAAAIMVCLIEQPLDKKVKAKIRTWNADADEFLKRFKLLRSDFNPIVAGCLNDSFDMDSDVYELIAMLKEREKEKVLAKELDLTKDHLDLLKYFMGIVLRSSEPALKNLTRHVSKLGDPDLTALFLQEDEAESNQEDIIAELKKFCKRVFGKAEEDLTVEDKNNLKASNPDKYKEYLKFLRDINEGTKQATLRFVRASGEPLVKATELVRFLKQNKIRSKIPEGFAGYIDENGGYYSEEKIKLVGAITGRLVKNPKYDPKTDSTFVYLHYPAFSTTGEPQRIVTVNFKKEKTSKKFGAVDALIKDLPAARTKWLAKLKTAKLIDPDVVCALLLELVYETSGRIGTVGQSGQGISTMVCKNYLNKAQNFFTLTYLGKGQVKQVHKVLTNTVQTKLIKQLLDRLIAGKKPSDLIFTSMVAGKMRHINGTMVNKYLRTLGVDPSVTAHKFRHARGSILAQEILDKAPSFKNKSEAEINKWFLGAMLKVGAELGHISGDKITATTAIQNYIDPMLIKNWFSKVGARPNNAIQSAINKVAKD